MKLNLRIDEYDVKSLKTINATVESIRKKCGALEQMASVMQRNIAIAERSFTSENMTRTKDVIKKYEKRLSDARAEFTELLKSVNEFTEKLKHAWREW